MRKILWILVAVALVGWILYSNIQQQKEQSNGKRNVYAVLPLTGEFAQYGQDIKNIISIYVSKKDLPFNIKYLDSEGSPSKAVTSLQQATLNDNHPIVLSVFTPIASALAPVVEQKGGFLFATAAVTVATNTHSYQRMSQSAEAIMDIISPYIIKNFKNISIVYTQDDHGLEELESLHNAFKGTQVKVLKQIPIALTTHDVKTEALKLISDSPDAIIVIGRTTQGYINIIKEIKKLNYKGKIIADSGLSNPPILAAVGDYANNLLLSTMTAEVEMSQPEKVTLLKKKLIKDGKNIYFVLIETIDSLDLIQYTLEHHLPFTQQTYSDIKTWNGVSGEIQFVGNGDFLSSAYTMAQIKDGKIIPLESEIK